MSTISDELPLGRRALSTSLDSLNFRDAVEEVVRLEISPVEIMQRGFETCLEMAGREVSSYISHFSFGEAEGGGAEKVDVSFVRFRLV